MQKWILPLAALLLLVPNFFNVDINYHNERRPAEEFDVSLLRLSSIEKLAAYTDSLASTKNISSNHPEYLLLVENIIAKRFFHGFSHYKLNENWVASVSEKIFGRGLACLVKPNDIMQRADGACSQQSIVMMELLKRKNIDYRKVGFPHHYAMEAKFNKQWYFADANQEPDMTVDARLHQNWKGQSDNLKQYYDPKIYTNLDYAFGIGQLAEIGPVNEVPAKNLTLFHSLTLLMSRFAWCLPLIILFAKSRKKIRAKVINMRQPVVSKLAAQRFNIS
ncbi:MAG: hypothetical protein ABIY51_14510 [Ferruginibacter sp.]